MSDEIPKETAAELAATLGTYESQLGEVEELLRGNPEDPAIQEIRGEVLTGLELTKTRLAVRKAFEAEESARTFIVDAVVDAQFDDSNWYTCKVTEVHDADDAAGVPKTWQVIAIGFSNRFSVTPERIRTWRPPSAIKKGFFIDAVNRSTGLFYPAVVDSITENNSAWVKFKGSDKLDEVPLTHVRIKSSGKKRDRDPKLEQMLTPEEKQREKKKQRKDEWRARVAAQAEEEEKGRRSWQDFQKKNQKKSVGKLSGLRTGSIFTTGAGRAGSTQDKPRPSAAQGRF